jgi:hypothetical protein
MLFSPKSHLLSFSPHYIGITNKTPAVHLGYFIATHASVQKVVTCSRQMAILSHKEKNNKNNN